MPIGLGNGPVYSGRMKTLFTQRVVRFIAVLLVVGCSDEGREQSPGMGTDVVAVSLSPDLIPDQSCIEQAAAMDLAAKTAYQTELRDLVVATRSDFTFLADISMTFQITLAQLRAAKIGWLSHQGDARLTTTQGASAFTNFEWSIEDNTAFAAADPAHADLVAKAAQWREMNDNHKVWPSFRAWFGEALASSDELAAITGQLVTARNQLEVHLATCP